MGRIRLDVPRVDQDVGICDAKSDLRLAEVEVLHQMECRVPDEPVVSWRSRIRQFVAYLPILMHTAWNWSMSFCQYRAIKLLGLSVFSCGHAWGPHSGGLGNRDPETTGSVVVSYLYFMHMAYLLSREGRCDHSGGLRVAYVSHAIEIEACEGYEWSSILLKLGLGVSRAVAWVWRFVARCC